MSQDAKREESEDESGPLETAHRGWIFAVAGLVSAGLLAGAYFLGLVGDRAIAVVVCLIFAAALFGIAAKVGLERASSGARFGVLAYAAVFVLVGFYPAYVELIPGDPAASGELGGAVRTLALPGAGSYRLVVSAPLSGGRDAHINYRLRVGSVPLDGLLERVTTYQRVRRGGSMAVPEDHNVSAHEVTAQAGDSVALDQVSGEASGVALTVRAFRIVPPWLIWALMVLVLAAGIFLEGKLLANSALSMTGASALLFGVMLETTNPATVLGPVLGSVLLGGAGGALAGSALGALGRKLFTPKETPGSRRPRGTRSERGEREGRGAEAKRA